MTKLIMARPTHQKASASVQISIVLLLLVYIPVFIFSPGLNPHRDHDHVLHEKDTCEKDACHIAIYHPGDGRGCDHKFHFTATPEKCPWCDIILAHQLVPLIAESEPQNNALQKLPINFYAGLQTKVYDLHGGRGPPSCS